MELLEYLETYCKNGNGHGSGSGYGSGDGYGYGYGSGYGYGNGNGSGSGSGYGSGDGYGLSEFEGYKSYTVDSIPTFIIAIHSNYAKAFTLKQNTVKVPCYIALTDDGYIAHGKTLRGAFAAAMEKSSQNKPFEERLRDFVNKHPDIDKEYDDLFSWHYILTGSCEFGRKQWCEQHRYKPTDSITIRKFIAETKNDYGGNIIKQLEKLYKL